MTLENLENLKKRGSDVGDLIKAETPEVFGSDASKLTPVEDVPRTSGNEDALGPIDEPSAEELIAEYNKKQQEGINKAE
jgi:hypothetical protein